MTPDGNKSENYLPLVYIFQSLFSDTLADTQLTMSVTKLGNATSHRHYAYHSQKKEVVTHVVEIFTEMWASEGIKSILSYV